ncbi:MAG: hypothetical protein CL878_00740 [Dehalococcoidia bacterium]|nr:hypothetical protein [Dehalococcoidia bacterium]
MGERKETYLRRRAVLALGAAAAATPLGCSTFGGATDTASDSAAKVGQSLSDLSEPEPTATVVESLPTEAPLPSSALPGVAATPASGQTLAYPTGIVLDGDGNLIVADRSNHRVLRLTPDGSRTVIAGTGTAGSGGDGGPAVRAEVRYPTGLAQGSDGSLYVADTSNHRIRTISPEGTIFTYVGVGGAGWSGDGDSAANSRVWFPQGLAIDAKGSLYIGDTHNQRVRRVDPDGIITTIAGTGLREFSGDGGPAVKADLNFLAGVAVDGSGGVYFADWDNHRVRRIAPDGVISTIAGTGKGGDAGDGGPATRAELRLPFGLALGGDGSLYIADTWNSRIRRIAQDGTISTVAGTGTWAASGDGGLAVEAQLGFPHGVAVGPDGNIWIADTGNHRIRKVATDGIITTVAP